MIQFTKMHGAGNDFVLLAPEAVPEHLLPEASRRLCDRKLGVGADGLLVAGVSSAADVRFRMFNPDGSEAEMCGNGLRCFARRIVDLGRLPRKARIETGSGVKQVEVFSDGSVRVDMGAPRIPSASSNSQGIEPWVLALGDCMPQHPQDVEATHGDPGVSPTQERVVFASTSGMIEACEHQAPLPLAHGEGDSGGGGRSKHRRDSASSAADADFEIDITSLSQPRTSYQGYAVCMGNPHLVIFEPISSEDLATVGPELEHHPRFPNRTNVHFAEVVNRNHVIQHTWERGAGITYACGTGACAVVVAGVLTDRLDRNCRVTLPGGELQVDWPEGGPVWMTGPTAYVFEGFFPQEAEQ